MGRFVEASGSLGVNKKLQLTPGTLSGGGAVAAHKRVQPIQDLMWNMRLQHQKTLGYYLQADNSCIDPAVPDCRNKIQNPAAKGYHLNAFEILVT